MYYFPCYKPKKTKNAPENEPILVEKYSNIYIHERHKNKITSEDSPEHSNVKKNSIQEWMRKSSNKSSLTDPENGIYSHPQTPCHQKGSKNSRVKSQIIGNKSVREDDPALLDINKNVLVQFTYMPPPRISEELDNKGLPNYLTKIRSSSVDSLTTDSSNESLTSTINVTERRHEVIRVTDSKASFGSLMDELKLNPTSYPYTSPSYSQLPFMMLRNDTSSSEAQLVGPTERKIKSKVPPEKGSVTEEVIQLPYSKSTNLVFFADATMSMTPTFVTIARNSKAENKKETLSAVQTPEIPKEHVYPFLPTSPIGCQLPFKVKASTSYSNDFKK